jgi:hypothetical protein
MSRQSLIDSLPVGPLANDGKDPMRDLPIKARRTRAVDQGADEHERQLLWAFTRWMKYPTKRCAREDLSHLMLAHEIRAYNLIEQTAQLTPAE